MKPSRNPSFSRFKQTEIESVLERLHLGIHSGDGSGINRLHWLGFVDFIIKNPQMPKKKLAHQLISVLCVKERTVLEYINCAVAWDVLILQDGVLYYNSTKKKSKPEVIPEKTDEEILENRR